MLLNRRPHERALRRTGVHVAEHPVVLEQEPHILAIQLAETEQAPDGRERAWQWLLLRPGITRDQRELLCQGALHRAARLVEHGFGLDGWQQQSDGRWRLCISLVELDLSLDSDEDITQERS